MASEHLQTPKTLNEMDVLFEADRLAAAHVAETAFHQEIATAISNITEINRISNARIQADSAVASARISADAEVLATELISRAELAAMDVKTQGLTPKLNHDQASSMITEVGYTAREEITNSASDTVKLIKEQAEAAIKQVSDMAKTSILEIKSIAHEHAERVRKNAEIARRDLDDQKQAERSIDSVTINAKRAAQQILTHSQEAADNLYNKVSNVIGDMNALANEALKTISEIVATAEAKILAARNKALEALQKILDVTLLKSRQ